MARCLGESARSPAYGSFHQTPSKPTVHQAFARASHTCDPWKVGEILIPNLQTKNQRPGDLKRHVQGQHCFTGELLLY